MGASSFAEFASWRDQARSIDLVAFTSEPMPLGDGPATNTDPAGVRLVSDNYFAVLRIPLSAGRRDTPTDFRGGHERYGD